jgi:hypothetical protein
MNTKFAVILDNGGGITFQTPSYCHHYDDPKQAAKDVKTFLNTKEKYPTIGWDGNEPENRLEYDYEIEKNGGYLWLSVADVTIPNIANAEFFGKFGQNYDEFFRALSE